MFTLIISLMFMGTNGIVSTLPTKQVAIMPREETRLNTPRCIKRSRGKGRAQSPYFAKYF
jgi:hypothetical protein